MIGLQTFWYTAKGLGPYAVLNRDLHEALLQLQISLAVISVVATLISAVVTEWRRALADGRAARKRLDRALEGARLALFEVDIASEHVYLTEAWAEMMGTEPGETNMTFDEALEITRTDEREGLWKTASEAIFGIAGNLEIERRVQRPDGEWIWIFARARVVRRDGLGRPLKVSGTIADITERVKTEQRVHHLATRDPLTNLINRTRFGDKLERAIEEASRRSGRVALISVGLDRFTAINNSLGRQIGDDVLKVVAERLLDASDNGVIVARAGETNSCSSFRGSGRRTRPARSPSASSAPFHAPWRWTCVSS
jgi:PAS domain S-box-containing protein